MGLKKFGLRFHPGWQRAGEVPGRAIGRIGLGELIVVVCLVLPLDRVEWKEKPPTLARGLEEWNLAGPLEAVDGCDRQPGFTAQFFDCEIIRALARIRRRHDRHAGQARTPRLDNRVTPYPFPS